MVELLQQQPQQKGKKSLIHIMHYFPGGRLQRGGVGGNMARFLLRLRMPLALTDDW